MTKRVLVTGGAGFIGRHVVRELLAKGYEPTILDSFIEQVHGDSVSADKICPGVQVINADVRNFEAVNSALAGVDHVIHLAAEIGVGQSMYEIARYVSANELGTAVLLEALSRSSVQRLIVASSMSIYGEGLYQREDGRLVEDVSRGQCRDRWDLLDEAGRPLTPVPTPEWKQPKLSSVYALNKFAQEQMSLIVPSAYGCEAVALRLFNVYGPEQALSNPYTGVLAIFAARILNGQPPMIFEDGQQMRDFVHVEDVARAFVQALNSPEAAGQTINIASGRSVTIAMVAQEILAAMGRDDLVPEITGQMRAGDIRHCIADISAARRLLGYEPQTDFSIGIAELAEWVGGQRAQDRVSDSRGELERRGLVS